MARRFTSIQRMNVPNPMAQFLDAPDPIYGTGVDGNAVLDGSTTILGMAPSSSRYTMTSDLYFHDLTLNTNIHLQTNGFRLFVKNQLNMANGSRIGFTTGFATAGSIDQGGAILGAVTNSLGGAGLNVATVVTATTPIAELGGAKYYTIPHQAIRGWAATASSTTPTFIRGGAGGLGQAGGGVVIIAARYITVTSGTAVISAPATAPAGGGVILIVSSHSSLPSGLTTDVTGQNPGTVNYMQLV
jgi:hypothetical protein